MTDRDHEARERRFDERLRGAVRKQQQMHAVELSPDFTRNLLAMLPESKPAAAVVHHMPAWQIWRWAARIAAAAFASVLASIYTVVPIRAWIAETADVVVVALGRAPVEIEYLVSETLAELGTTDIISLALIVLLAIERSLRSRSSVERSLRSRSFANATHSR
jgi:hypothetical protein